MTTPVLQLTGDVVCVSFVYHMFGSGVGQLTVTLLNAENAVNDDVVLFSKAGSQADHWLWFNRTLTSLRFQQARVTAL